MRPKLAAAGVAAAGAAAIVARRRHQSSSSARNEPVAELADAVPGTTDLSIARRPPRGDLGPRLATPPPETPGPSVPGPLLPQSETERREWADEHEPDAEALESRGISGPDPLDVLAEQEASAAAAEAAEIGGVLDREPGITDPAMIPLYEAGQGEQDGWDSAERDLIDTIEGVDPTINPYRDAFPPEAESDRASGVYGDADGFKSSEVTTDPDELDSDEEDPAEGPGIDRVRGANLQPNPEATQRPDRMPDESG